MSELKAEGLKKRYKSRTVVKDLSLEVASGEVVGLLGPNGAGKPDLPMVTHTNRSHGAGGTPST